MKTSFEQYSRLAKAPFGKSSLWAGQDHLVHVRGSGPILPFTEVYRRYRYADIQAFSVVQTSRVGSFVGLSIVLLLLLPAIVASITLAEGLANTRNVILVAILSPLFLVALALFLRLWILGPKCYCHIQTSLSQERLIPIKRLHQARQLISAVDQPIREAQEHLLNQGGVPASPREEELGVGVARLAGFYSIPKIFLPTFASVFALGLLVMAAISLESIALTAALICWLLVVGMLLLVALIAAVKRPTPDSAKVSLWAVQSTVGILLLTMTYYYLQQVALDPAYSVNTFAPLEALAGIGSDESPIFFFILTSLALVLLALSCMGIFTSLSWQRRIKTQQASTSLPLPTDPDVPSKRSETLSPPSE